MSADCSIDMRFFTPPEQFDGCFTTFYYADIKVADGGTVKDHLQPEWANLRFMSDWAPNAMIDTENHVELSKYVATGPSSHPTKFEIGTTRLWGIGFMPVGWARFMEWPAVKFANRIFDGNTHRDMRKFAPLSKALFAQGSSPENDFDRIVAFFDSINRPHPDEQRIRKVHMALIDPAVTNVSEFCSRAAVSERTLERVCKRYFGFTPKLLLRRQRLLRSLTTFLLDADRSWSASLDDAYYDHAHFTREFHYFMNMNPTEYGELEHPILSAFITQRAKVWGSPAQILDPPARA